MATITKTANGVKVEDNNNHIYLFPFNTIMLTANENSDMVNIKLLGDRKTLLSINYKTITYPTANSSEDMCKVCEKIIYKI